MKQFVSVVMSVFLLVGTVYGYTLQSSERAMIEATWPRVVAALDRNEIGMPEFIDRIRDYFGVTNLHETKIAYLQEFITLAEDEQELRRVAAFGFHADIVVEDDEENLYVSTTGLPYNHNVKRELSCADENTDGIPDRPYEIQQFEFTYTFPKNPELATRPYEIDKEIGIATNGVLLYHAKNDRGSFAAISDVLDRCEGQPDQYGKYHYHSELPCLELEKTDLIGYAFDGHKIYGSLEEDGEEPINLDVCNGHKHSSEEPYHYHRIVGDHTNSLIGCFRAQPVWSNLKQGEGAPLTNVCKELYED